MCVVPVLKGLDSRMTYLTKARNSSVRFFCASSLVAAAGLCTPALAADLPAALDRLPSTAAVVIGINNLEGASGKLEKFVKSMGLPENEGEDDPIQLSRKLLGTPGINKSGSLAIALVAGKDGKVVMSEDGGAVPTAVVIVPVSDYSAFVKAMGAEKAEGITTVTIDAETGFAKDIGGGYAALSMAPGLLETFEGKAGGHSALNTSLGKNGASVAEGADVIIIANVAYLQEQLKEASAKMAEQVQQVSAMVPGDQGKSMRDGVVMAQMVFNNFARDGSSGVLSFKFAEKGVSIDIGAQFKEGSEVAGFFAAPGKSDKFLSRVPNLPFYLAGSIDATAPGIKKIFKNLTTMSAAMVPEGDKGAAATLQATLAAADTLDGASFVLGASPAAMMGGGLFVNTAAYFAAKDGTALKSTLADAIKSADGRKSGPVTTKATYNVAAADVNGVKVDTWNSTMSFDPNDPMAGQGQMMMGMIFGQGGLSGMNAAVDGGVVSVYSQNTPLMTTAIDAAKTGKNGLGEDKLVKDSQSNLPPNRTFELFIGVKPLMDAGIGFMSMMGGGPEIKVPAQMSPIALGGTTNDGGVAFRLFFPSDVIAGIADVIKQSKAEEADEDADMDPDAEPKKDGEKAPRF